jgi:hypothetical protein
MTDLHPSYAFSDVRRELKISTSVWIKESELFRVKVFSLDCIFSSVGAEKSGGVADLRFHRRLFIYRHIGGFLVETVPRFLRCV